MSCTLEYFGYMTYTFNEIMFILNHAAKKVEEALEDKNRSIFRLLGEHVH